MRFLSIDNIIMGAQGVLVAHFSPFTYLLMVTIHSVAIGGLTISIIGAAAGGFGFFAGQYAPLLPCSMELNNEN